MNIVFVHVCDSRSDVEEYNIKVPLQGERCPDPSGPTDGRIRLPDAL